MVSWFGQIVQKRLEKNVFSIVHDVAFIAEEKITGEEPELLKEIAAIKQQAQEIERLRADLARLSSLVSQRSSPQLSAEPARQVPPERTSEHVQQANDQNEQATELSAHASGHSSD